MDLGCWSSDMKDNSQTRRSFGSWTSRGSTLWLRSWAKNDDAGRGRGRPAWHHVHTAGNDPSSLMNLYDTPLCSLRLFIKTRSGPNRPAEAIGGGCLRSLVDLASTNYEIKMVIYKFWSYHVYLSLFNHHTKCPVVRVAHTMQFVFNFLLVLWNIVIKVVDATSLDMCCPPYNLFKASSSYHVGELIFCGS